VTTEFATMTVELQRMISWWSVCPNASVTATLSKLLHPMHHIAWPSTHTMHAILYIPIVE
jgi:hypothetical protein